VQDQQDSSFKSYQDLAVWQRAMDLTVEIYEVTKTWPSAERFSMIDQIRRAAVSIPANIAEGQGRSGPREFLHHCSIANGSLSEVETLLLLAYQLTYIDNAALNALMLQTNEVGRMLRGLIKRLRVASPSR